MIHGLDVTGANDLPRTSTDEATRRVLDSLVTGGVARHFGIDPSGRTLRANDLDWESGDGEVVEASAGDLVLALSGRRRPGLDLRRA